MNSKEENPLESKPKFRATEARILKHFELNLLFDTVLIVGDETKALADALRDRRHTVEECSGKDLHTTLKKCEKVGKTFRHIVLLGTRTQVTEQCLKIMKKGGHLISVENNVDIGVWQRDEMSKKHGVSYQDCGHWTLAVIIK